MLAAMLEEAMAVLDSRHGRVLLLDARMQAAWRACTGLTAEEIAGRIGETPSGVAALLEALAEAGLVASHRSKWTAAAVRWV